MIAACENGAGRRIRVRRTRAARREEPDDWDRRRRRARLLTTPYYEIRGAYRARCSAADGAHVLQVHGPAGPLTPFPDATWGIHLVESNIGLGTVLGLV